MRIRLEQLESMYLIPSYYKACLRVVWPLLYHAAKHDGVEYSDALSYVRDSFIATKKLVLLIANSLENDESDLIKTLSVLNKFSGVKEQTFIDLAHLKLRFRSLLDHKKDSSSWLSDV